MGRRDSAVLDSLFSIGGVLAQGLSRFAYTALVGRLLGAEALAAVNVGFAVSILLSLLWPTAAGNAAAAFARRDRPRTRRALQRSVLLSLVPLCLGAGAVAAVLGGTPAAIAQAAALTAAWSGYIFARGVFIGAGRVRSAAVWDVVTGALAICLLLVFIAQRWEQILLVPAVVGYGVFALAAALSVGRAERGADAADAPVATRAFVFWNSLALIATNGLMQASMVAASALDTPSAAGQFAAALSLATPVSMVAQAVTQAMLPRFGQWLELPAHETTRAVRRAAAALAAVMAAGTGCVALVLPLALPLIYGDRYAPAVPLAQALMVAVFGFSLSVFFAAYLATVGRAREATALAGIGSAVGVGAMIVVGASAGGSIGAVVGTGAGMLLSLVLLAAAALRHRPRPGAAHDGG